MWFGVNKLHILKLELDAFNLEIGKGSSTRGNTHAADAVHIKLNSVFIASKSFRAWKDIVYDSVGTANQWSSAKHAETPEFTEINC